MSIGQNNGGNVEGKIINKEKGTIEKVAPVEAINEGDKIELKKTEKKEDIDKKIKDLESDLMNSGDERNEGENKGKNESNKEKEENKFKAFEIKKDAVTVEMGDSLDNKDLDVVTMISIDSDGKTYGDDKLDYEQLGLKLIEAQDALDRLQKKKEKLPPANKFLETIRKAFSNEYTINSEINKMMVSKATQGIGRLEKRVEYLEGRISKELS